MLIDSRHGIKPPDKEMMDMLDEAAMSYQIVLTKCDKNKSAKEIERIKSDCAEMLSTRPAAHPEVLTTAALAGEGVHALQHAVLEAAQLSHLME